MQPVRLLLHRLSRSAAVITFFAFIGGQFFSLALIESGEGNGPWRALFLAHSVTLVAIGVLWWSQLKLSKRLGLTVQYYTPESGTDLYAKAKELALNARENIVVVNGYFEARGGGSEAAEKEYYEALERWAKVPGRKLERFLQVEQGGHPPILLDREGQQISAPAARLASGYEEMFLRHVGRLAEMRDEPRSQDRGEVYLFLSAKLRQSTFVLFDDDHLLWAILEGDPSTENPKLELSGFFVIRDPASEVIRHFTSAVRRINSHSCRLDVADVSAALHVLQARGASSVGSDVGSSTREDEPSPEESTSVPPAASPRERP